MDFISEQGYDSIDKTYVAYTPLENYVCIAIAESYDNETKENSAQIAVEAALTAFEKKPSLKRLKEYIRYANDQVILHSTRSELKVSLTVLVSDYTRMRYAYCGNTKLYILYENLFTHISKTQTNYQSILDQSITDSKSNGEPDREEIHNLTEYLGRQKRVKPFVSKVMELTEGSTILFATSNLWGRLSEIEILDAYEYTNTGKEFLEILQELLLSLQEEHDQRMGSFTAAFLYIEKTFKEDVSKKKKRKRLLWAVFVAVSIVFFLSIIVVLFIRAADRKKIKEVETYDQRGERYVSYGNYERALEEYEQAVEQAEGLSFHNFQYIEEKKKLSRKVADREAVLQLCQKADAAYEAQEYEQAKKLYTQIQKESAYLELDELVKTSSERIEEIVARQQVLQYISLGDMYQSTEDYEEALFQYNRALNELVKLIDLKLQGDVQAKIFAIRQKQKEVSAEEEEKQKEAAQQKEEAAAEKKAAAANRAAIKINTYIANANNALEEGRTERARELYKQALSKYNKFSGSSEDADKLYKDITSLGQAVAEAEAKAAEQAREGRLAQAARYSLQAKEAARGGDAPAAMELYKDALEIYQELNVWDERAEAVYDAMNELKQADAPSQDETSDMDETSGSETEQGQKTQPESGTEQAPQTVQKQQSSSQKIETGQKQQSVRELGVGINGDDRKKPQDGSGDRLAAA